VPNIPILVFFGRRGAGLDLTIHLSFLLNKKGISHQVWVDSNNVGLFPNKSDNFRIVNFDFPHSISDFIKVNNYMKVLKSIFRIFKKVHKLQSAYYVQIMPSPFDILVDIACSNFGINKFNKSKVIRCIHDAKAHLGENWPRERSILQRIKRSDEVIFFSRAVSGAFNIQNKIVHHVALPGNLHFYETLEESRLNIGDDVIKVLQKIEENQRTKLLLIGRIKSYKGIDILIDEFELLDEDFSLLIAGEGELYTTLPQNCYLVDRWLNKKEFDLIIDSSEILLFPYVEASQSGTIPIALAKHKKIVIADKSGLVEQSKHSNNVVVYRQETKGDLAEAIKRAQKKELEFGAPKDAEEVSLENVLISILLESTHG